MVAYGHIIDDCIAQRVAAPSDAVRFAGVLLAPAFARRMGVHAEPCDSRGASQSSVLTCSSDGNDENVDWEERCCQAEGLVQELVKQSRLSEQYVAGLEQRCARFEKAAAHWKGLAIKLKRRLTGRPSGGDAGVDPSGLYPKGG